jgi:hypothetical protein
MLSVSAQLADGPVNRPVTAQPPREPPVTPKAKRIIPSTTSPAALPQTSKEHLPNPNETTSTGA